MSVLETQGVPKLAENVLEALGGDVAEAHENWPKRQTCRQRQGHYQRGRLVFGVCGARFVEEESHCHIVFRSLRFR